MDTTQAAEFMASWERVEFYVHGIGMAIGFIAGSISWRLVVLAKNQRSFW